MSATAEVEQPLTSQVVEHLDEFPETIQQIQGAQVVPKNFTSQVSDSQGTPIIQTPPTSVVTSVSPPSDTTTLTAQSKGKVTESATWLAMLWLRIIKKAMFFGWKVVEKSST